MLLPPDYEMLQIHRQEIEREVARQRLIQQLEVARMHRARWWLFTVMGWSPRRSLAPVQPKIPSCEPSV